MYSHSQQPRLTLGVNVNKPDVSNAEHLHAKSSGGALSPDITPTQPSLLYHENTGVSPAKQVGRYVVHGISDDHSSSLLCKAIDPATNVEYVCKIYPISKYTEVLSPYWSVGSHPHLNNVVDISIDSSRAYLFFHKCHEDLHSYVRRKRKMADSEACRLFSQIVCIVSHCHCNNVVLRDLKLRKFVFKDASNTHLVLDNLEDSHIDDGSDLLTDRHGCPAYVSPEILHSTAGYSGKAADAWSLGVILYTMLVGQYPFHDADVCALFKKIRQGTYLLPEGLCRKARCLLRNLLRLESAERMTTNEIIHHVWFEGRDGEDDVGGALGGGGASGGGGFNVASNGNGGGGGGGGSGGGSGVFNNGNVAGSVGGGAVGNRGIIRVNEMVFGGWYGGGGGGGGLQFVPPPTTTTTALIPPRSNINNYNANNIYNNTNNINNSVNNNNNNFSAMINNNNNNNGGHGNDSLRFTRVSPFVSASTLENDNQRNLIFSHNNNNNNVNINNSNNTNNNNSNMNYRHLIMNHLNNTINTGNNNIINHVINNHNNNNNNNNINNNNNNNVIVNAQKDVSMDDQMVPEWEE